MYILSQKPTIKVGAYAAAKAVGGLLTFKFPRKGAGRRTVLLKEARILDNNGTPAEADLDLHLFGNPLMAVADDAAFRPALTWVESAVESSLTGDSAIKESLYYGKINFATYVESDLATAGSKIARVAAADLLLPVVGGAVYGQLQANGTPTYAAADQLIVIAHFAEYA